MPLNDFSPQDNDVNVLLSKHFTDQKPGTSGLRKSTKHFLQPHYLESFVEAILQTLPGIQGGVLILGGDGRFGNRQGIDVITRMAAAHGVQKVVTSVDGILSTPAASHLIRSRKAVGGIILSASHNSGGPNGDFGVKVNGPNGGPASESLTNEIFEKTKTLHGYRIVKKQSVSLNNPGEYSIGATNVEVIDGIDDYIALMENIFDFDKIRSFLTKDFLIAFDALNAVTGPYAKKLFEDILGAPTGTVRNGMPLEDFGGMHPDPNLTYAKDLADLLLSGKEYSFGAACDGDGDRNMILGQDCFVNPSDSLAVLVANSDCVPAYANGLLGVARSMPTSTAVDVVAKDLGIPCFETPTGWKFFGNLLDSGQITLCGEESFGTGSNHVREKDGLWAVLFWLQILSNKQCSVKELMQQHWSRFGRHYYSRHDYESISQEKATDLYNRVEMLLPSLTGSSFAGHTVSLADNFTYTDPVDNSITSRQGLRILLDNGSRVVLRLSGTGTQGATLRVYLESYVPSMGDVNQDPQSALSNLIEAIDSMAEITSRTGLMRPTVIT
ncbi:MULTISPECIES: alpha-D-glucose phosphate-specific phosphoglucomutase [unclassified Prochlorococcus]|uniref:alpha-D-glucose phosphate-specific phosphoglucomutase n=1 Tax=unclassified Prochlorococcus TaxID=2627481 RepID=UPI000533818D|nr:MULTISPECIES: alpha-D-glucose phosphate-specific phosphoglucomutase [unclassified Prochlorococcus]KGG16864.1 phosphoglucomutase [Prochlorococcus sp. MIT 0602]KGG18162.1 phosphoglucomutase [Prochlorococcus sp. MIT 0603]